MEQETTLEMTAKTPEEAIEIALKELDADRGEVEIDVVSRGKPGLLGIGSVPARVRVTLLHQPSDVVMATTEILNTLISQMGVEAVATLTKTNSSETDGPVFNIEGEDSGLLIGRRGETLKALQFLVNVLTRKKSGERTRIFLDVAGYQQRRIDALGTMAMRVAQRVVSSGRSIALEPMPANERRIIHVTLSDDPTVTTESMGEGNDRQVVVQPSEGD